MDSKTKNHSQNLNVSLTDEMHTQMDRQMHKHPWNVDYIHVYEITFKKTIRLSIYCTFVLF